MMSRSATASSIPAALIVALLASIGCGQPSIPLPPSLNLPRPVENLTAQRTGDTVTLHWTMPKETTDKLPLKGPVQAEIWFYDIRQFYGCHSDCSYDLHSLRRIAVQSFAPASQASFTYTLPAQANYAGQFWSVRLLNKAGRFAGIPLVGSVETIGGPAVPTPAAVTVTSTAAGVHLTWAAQPNLNMPDDIIKSTTQSILVHRSLIALPPTKPAKPVPTDMDLVINGDPGTAIDNTALWNAQYSYSIQRIYTSYVGNDTYIKTNSLPSVSITVATKDIYPPAVPTGLAVVLAATNTIELSWLPNTEPDLTGYIVYRSTATSTHLTRLTTAPITVPSFQDATAAPATQYFYCISAIDTSDNESPCSASETITLP